MSRSTTNLRQHSQRDDAPQRGATMCTIHGSPVQKSQCPQCVTNQCTIQPPQRPTTDQLQAQRVQIMQSDRRDPNQNPRKQYARNFTGMFRSTESGVWHKCTVNRQDMDRDILYVFDEDEIDDSIEENAPRKEIAVKYRSKTVWRDSVHDFRNEETDLHYKVVHAKGWTVHTVLGEGDCFYRALRVAAGKSAESHMVARKEIMQYARDNATDLIPTLSLMRGRSDDNQFTKEEYVGYIQRHESAGQPATPFEVAVAAAAYRIQIDCWGPDSRTNKIRDTFGGALCPDGNPQGVVNLLDWQRRRHYDLIVTGVQGHFPDAHGRSFSIPARSNHFLSPTITGSDACDAEAPLLAAPEQQRDDRKDGDDHECENDQMSIDAPERTITDLNASGSTMNINHSATSNNGDNCSVATGMVSAFTTTEYFRREVGSNTPPNGHTDASPTLMLDEYGNQLWDDDDTGIAQRGPVKLRYFGQNVMKKWNGTYRHMFICSGCHNAHARLSGKPWDNPNIKKYLVCYLCPTCQEGAERLETEYARDKQKKDRIMFREYKCIEDGCKFEYSTHHHSWKGKRGYNNWNRHYKLHHPTTEYLEITGNHHCRGDGCPVVLSLKNDLCRACSKKEQESNPRDDLHRDPPERSNHGTT